MMSATVRRCRSSRASCTFAIATAPAAVPMVVSPAAVVSALATATVTTPAATAATAAVAATTRTDRPDEPHETHGTDQKTNHFDILPGSCAHRAPVCWEDG